MASVTESENIEATPNPDEVTEQQFNIENKVTVTQHAQVMSGDYYHENEQKTSGVISAATRVRDILADVTPLEKDQIELITQFTDIHPTNLIENWDDLEFQPILHKITNLDSRWVLGSEKLSHEPRINLDTIVEVYFAMRQQSFNGYSYRLVGKLRDPRAIEDLRESADFKPNLLWNQYPTWDPCWDVYFYINADSENRGAFYLSREWVGMAMFGLDTDYLRDACENGDWVHHKHGKLQDFEKMRSTLNTTLQQVLDEPSRGDLFAISREPSPDDSDAASTSNVSTPANHLTT